MDLLATSPIFGAAEAKLRRAFQDLHTLDTDVSAFIDAHSDPLAFEFEDGEWWVARIKALDNPPPDFSVLVGNIAYQCLSAFNHLVWELASRKMGRKKVYGPSLKGGIQLPVALTPQAFADHALVTGLKKRKGGLVSKQALAVIEGLQPYKDGHGPKGPLSHPLPLIKEIADSDKHRVLAPIYVQLKLGMVTWAHSDAAVDPTYETLLPPGGVFEDGTAFARVKFRKGNAEANVQVDRQPKFDILFESDNWTIRRFDVSDMARWSYDRLHRFAPLFPAK